MLSWEKTSHSETARLDSPLYFDVFVLVQFVFDIIQKRVEKSLRLRSIATFLKRSMPSRCASHYSSLYLDEEWIVIDEPSRLR